MEGMGTDWASQSGCVNVTVEGGESIHLPDEKVLPLGICSTASLLG
jgi:hypothetical protein